MDKRKTKAYRDRLLARRESLFSQVTEAEMSSRERDLEATQDPADMAANAYTKELLILTSSFQPTGMMSSRLDLSGNAKAFFWPSAASVALPIKRSR